MRFGVLCLLEGIREPRREHPGEDGMDQIAISRAAGRCRRKDQGTKMCPSPFPEPLDMDLNKDLEEINLPSTYDPDLNDEDED